MFCSVNSKANKMSRPSYQTKSKPTDSCMPVNSGCAGVEICCVSMSSLIKCLCYMDLGGIIISSLYTDCVMLISETILELCSLIGMVKENSCAVINVAA